MSHKEKIGKKRKLALFSVLVISVSILYITYFLHVFACEHYAKPNNRNFNSIATTLTTGITFNIHDFLRIEPDCKENQRRKKFKGKMEKQKEALKKAGW